MPPSDERGLSTPMSTPNWRVFVAVVPSARALTVLSSALEEARALPAARALRFTDAARLHLTLRFLGSVPEARVSALAAVCDAVAQRTAAFPLTLAGAGAFASVGRASVVWIGATTGAAELTALAEALDPGFEALGFAREERAFTPHLTVARSKRPSAQRATVERLARLSVDTHVAELVLMRSHLGAAARYEALERFALSAAPREPSRPHAPKAPST